MSNATWPVTGSGGIAPSPFAGGGINIYASTSAFPTATVLGQQAVAADSVPNIWEWNGTSWVQAAGGAPLSLGNLTGDTNASIVIGNGANAVVGTGTTITQSKADGTSSGYLSAGVQTIGGQKTFLSAPILDSLTASQALILDGSKVMSTIGYGINGVSNLASRDSSGNSSFNSLTLDSDLILVGATSGFIDFSVPATVSSYPLVWPSAQASVAGQALTNDATGALSWSTFLSGISVGTFGNAPNANAATISGSSTIVFQPADGTHPGSLTSGSQTIGGQKTFLTAPILDSLTASQAVVLNGSKVASSLAFTSSPTASTLVSRNSSGNAGFNNYSANASQTIVAGGQTVLTAASGRIQYLYGIGMRQDFVLPDATTLEIGTGYQFTNISYSDSDIYLTGGMDIVATALAGAVIELVCLDNSSPEGTWDTKGYLPTGASFSTAGLTYRGSLQLYGSTLGSVTIQPASLITDYTLILPSAQGGASTVLTNDGSGVLSWQSPSTGSVTAVSVASSNGFAGSSSGGSTPSLTLSTTVTGILSGNGTAISAASTTGSGSVVLANSPSLVSPVLGAASGTSLNLSGLTSSQLVATDGSKNLVSQAIGNLTAAGTDGISVTSGTGSVIGSGTSIAQHVADLTHNGYLSSTDWLTFNSKQSTLSIGAFGSTPTSDAAIISGNSIIFQPADGSKPGSLTANTQNIGGQKTFLSAPILDSLTASTAVVLNGSKVATSLAYTSAATASTLVSRDSNANVICNNFTRGFLSIDPSPNLGLGVGVAGYIQLITAGLTSNVFMPAANTLPLAWSVTIENATIKAHNLKDDGGNLLFSLGAGITATLTVTNIGTSNGVWNVVSSSSGSGTVTTVSVASSNGFAGSSSGGNTPILTLSTSVTGILSGNGTAISAASTSGSGDVVLATSPSLVTPKANNFISTQTNTVSAGGTTTLSASTSDYIQNLTGTLNQTYTLPSASGLTNGFGYRFQNNSTGSITIRNTGAGFVASVASGGALEVHLADNSTSNGVWDVKGLMPSSANFGTSGLGVDGIVTASGLISANRYVGGFTSTVTAAQTVTMDSNSTQYQESTGSSTITYKLPDTSTLVLTGSEYKFFNLSSGTVTIQSSAANTIGTLSTNQAMIVVNNTTAANTAAAWDYFIVAHTPGSVTTGNLTDTGTDGITVTGGTGAVIGSGTSISQHIADSSHNGYLSSGDWLAFSGKQDPFTGLTVNGVIYATSGSNIASTATGSQYQALIVNASGPPSFQALNLSQAASHTGTLGIGSGGTGVTSAPTTSTASAFAAWDSNKNISINNVLDGYTTTVTSGQTIAMTVGSTRNQVATGSSFITFELPVVSTLPLGASYTFINNSGGSLNVHSSGGNLVGIVSTNLSLTVLSNATTGTSGAVWDVVTPITTGTGSVTSVDFVGDGTVLSTTPSTAVTSSGSLTATLKLQVKNKALMGPTTGGNAAPTFRSFVAADFVAPGSISLTSTAATTGWVFQTASSSLAIGDTYTNNGNTYTSLGTAGSATTLFFSGAAAPQTSGTLTRATGSGSATIAFTSRQALATFTPDSGVLYLKVKGVGGGAGGNGGGASGNGGVGTAGTNTYFGAYYLIANGGSAASAGATNGGVGGSYAAVGSGTYGFGSQGGQGGPSNATSVANLGVLGGAGGNSPWFGGGGASPTLSSAGNNAITNSGGGGAGGSNAGAAGEQSGAGGGAGGYFEAIITNTGLQSSYYYTIGLGGAGGAGGTATGGLAGGAGADGRILIEEYFQ